MKGGSYIMDNGGEPKRVAFTEQPDRRAGAARERAPAPARKSAKKRGGDGDAPSHIED